MSHILSLTSCASDPAVPFFSRETVARAVQTVVDGFLETYKLPSYCDLIYSVLFYG